MIRELIKEILDAEKALKGDILDIPYSKELLEAWMGERPRLILDMEHLNKTLIDNQTILGLYGIKILYADQVSSITLSISNKTINFRDNGVHIFNIKKILENIQNSGKDLKIPQVISTPWR